MTHIRAIPAEMKWDASLPIYASPQFLRTASPTHGWLAGEDASGALRCILPFYVVRKWGLTLVRFTVETVPLVGNLSVEAERQFLNSAVAHFGSIGVDVIIPATFNSVFRTHPDGAIVAPFGSYVVDLSAEESVLWSRVHSKHRNVIRNATNKGVTIKTGLDNLETAFDLVRESFLRSANGMVGRLRVKARMSYGSFRDQVLALGEENVRVFVADYQGIPQSAAVMPFSRYGAYYMHGGNVASPLTGASNLLQWEAIRHFRELGVRRYDFFGGRVDPQAGSKIEGIMKFKERFGGPFIEGCTWKFAFRPSTYAFYSLAARVRSGGDVVDQERQRRFELATKARLSTQTTLTEQP
jgi:hypothetical protein